MKREIYLKTDNKKLVFADLLVIGIMIAGVAFNNILLGLIGLLGFWYRHITIVVKEVKTKR